MIPTINSQDFLNLIVKGGSPGQHTPGWDKGWPPKPKPQPKIAQRDPLDELNRGLIDQSTFDALKSTSPHLFVDDGTLPNVPIGPQPRTDPLTGMPIDTVQGLPAVGNMLGIQVAGNPSMDITGESSTTRKIRGIRNLIKGGSPGEKDAAVEMLKRLSVPQLPPV
jgi:hypothetical protein